MTERGTMTLDLLSEIDRAKPRPGPHPDGADKFADADMITGRGHGGARRR